MIGKNLPTWEAAAVALILVLGAAASSARTTPDKMDLLKKIQAGEMIYSALGGMNSILFTILQSSRVK